MLESIRAELPDEACGLLAGENHTSIKVYPVENILHSPTKFLMEPKQQISALLEIEANNWDLIAIYHSHPSGPPFPSETDIQEYYYPEIPCLIWFRSGTHWICRAFLIQSGEVMKIDLDYV